MKNDYLKAEASEIAGEMIQEFMEATEKFGRFNSLHEGYAVILEELEELWDNIKANADINLTRKEAIQVGAMAMRFVYDLCRLRKEEV